jgi:hypothetical protein
LWYLDLSGTGITDEGLTQLTNLKTLQEILLNGTRVTPGGVKSLRSSLPSLTSVKEPGAF